jgi:hypothetical protein
MCESRRRIVSVLIVACLLAVPSRGLAQGLPDSGASDENRAVPGGSAAATLAPDARRPFDPASLARAVHAELRLQEAKRGQGAAAPATRKHDSLWNGVLIGAGIGAVVGGAAALSGGSCDGPDYGGGCAMVGAAGAGSAVAIGVIGGALLGAGIGAIVDWLIK